MKNLHTFRKAILGVISAVVISAIYNGSAHACQLTIFGNSNKPPKYYNDKQGKPHGILIDMMNYIGKEMNCRFHIQLHPWKRAYKYALEGKGGIIGFSKNSERLKVFDYSDVMFYDDMVLVTMKSKTFRYNKIEDLRGKTLGITLGASFGDEFDNAVSNQLLKFHHSSNKKASFLVC